MRSAVTQSKRASGSACVERHLLSARHAAVGRDGEPQRENIWIAERLSVSVVNHLHVGIGLAIVRQIIEAHGGRVGASSGGGRTRVWFQPPDLGA